MATAGPKESVLVGRRSIGLMSAFVRPIARGLAIEVELERAAHAYRGRVERAAWRDALLASHPDLRAASDNLDGVRERAREFGISAPWPRHVERVREILSDLHDHVPRFYMSYLMLDGQIAIDIRNETSGSGILIKIDGGGSVTCIYDTRDNEETEFYSPSDQFPDQAVFDTIRRLDEEVAP